MTDKRYCVKCKHCGFVDSPFKTKCSVCGGKAQLDHEIKRTEKRENKIIDDNYIKKTDVGVVVVEKNYENGLYDIKFRNSDIFGLPDITLEELKSLKRQITKIIKRERGKN